MKKVLLKISLTAVLLTLLLIPALVSAMNPPTAPSGLNLPGAGSNVNAEDALYGVITTVLNTLIGLLGLIAVIIVIYGGFKYMASGGDDTKVKAARGLLIAGLIGLMIIIFSWLIASYVLTILYANV